MDEVQRLETLRQYAVLDTPPEEALDDLTALVATICEMPIALITLVDEQREWFKSRVGLTAAEAPRATSFCAHALGHPELFIVPDAMQDPRFADNPLVTGEPGIRFYAGAPLVSPEGAVLGALCVMDRVPRMLIPVQELALRVLSRQVMTHLKLGRQWRELQASEGKLRAIFEAEPECVKLLGADATFHEMNAAGLQLIEADSLENVAGQSLLPLVVPEDRAAVSAMLEAVANGERRTVEYRIVGLKGTSRWVEMNGAPFREAATGQNLVLGVSHDITVRKRAEAKLKLLEACVERLNDIVVITEAEPQEEPGPRILFVNDAFVRRTGYTREEVLGRSPRFLQGPKTNRAEVQRIATAQRQWKHVRAELINYTKGGEEFWIELDIVPVADAAGQFTHWVAVERDITERKRNGDRFSRLVDSNAQGVMFWNTKGQITGANDAFLHLVGYSRDDLEVGLIDWMNITPPEYADLDRKSMEEIAHKGVCAPYEKEFVRKDGSRVPLLIGAASFEDNPEEGVCFAVDLTERKKLEQQFLRTQRMESIGTLAGGIAHDLNNTLGPIIMSLDLLKLKFTDASSQELLAVISSSAHRGADMVSQVLSFARGVEGRRMEVQVKHLIRDIEKICNDTLLKHIQVRTIVPYELWTVRGDPTQLHQVLLNLCLNARDAMPMGGTLTISAENLSLDAQYAGQSLNVEAKAGPYVFLQVKDTGAGIPPEVLEKIFDPFFTTKDLGKGTGLGLSTSLAILKSHGGFIHVYSEVGKGTTFKIYIPAQDESSPEAAAELAAELPRGNQELILVVDDEAAVRQITQQTLEAFGYRVVLAADGAEAVAVFARRGAEIAVVLTDMMMPIMDGPATIQVLRRMNSKVRIIGSSGLTPHGHVAHAHSLGLEHFLPKPYTAETLLKAIKQVLLGQK